MKFQKLVLPILVLAIISLLYFSYFSPKDELGLFSDFDTNSNANKEIIVKILPEKGFANDGSGGITFYVEDRAARQIKVTGQLTLPVGFEAANRIILIGHLSGDSFHAHEVKIKD